VLAGLDVIETLKGAGVAPARPIALAAFTNEEGVRYAPDMMGSLVHAGGLPVEAALATVGTDGSVLGAELERIGYAGAQTPGILEPHAYLELHVEQGPVLVETRPIGAVEPAGHLGSASPSRACQPCRHDADVMRRTPVTRPPRGHVPCATGDGLERRHLRRSASGPNASTSPARATFTVDLPTWRLQRRRCRLSRRPAAKDGRAAVGAFTPVVFDAAIVRLVEGRALAWIAVRRMTSGAGHDAQMIARIAPAAMIFVPSTGGISHNRTSTPKGGSHCRRQRPARRRRAPRGKLTAVGERRASVGARVWFRPA
jgi:N-carbamoyl-L-amino-acid hydrolase